MPSFVSNTLLEASRPWGVVLGLIGLSLLLGPRTAAGQEMIGAGAFSRLGFGARGISLGNALVADASGDASPHYNPALLPATTRQQVSLSGAVMAFDRDLQYLEFRAPLGPTAGIGLSLTHAGVNGIDGRNRDGYHTEDLSTDQFALSLSFGNQFADRFSVGTSLTVYQSNLVSGMNPVRGFGVDVGVGVEVTDRLYVAGTVNDILAKYDWNASAIGGGNHTDRFPLRIRVGASYALGDKVRLLAEVESRTVKRERRITSFVITNQGPSRRTRTEAYRFHGMRGRVGASYRAVEGLSFRAGIDRIGVSGTNGLRPSAGFGLEQSLGELDLQFSYTAAVEPHVRSLMHLGTIELFLSE